MAWQDGIVVKILNGPSPLHVSLALLLPSLLSARPLASAKAPPARLIT